MKNKTEYNLSHLLYLLHNLHWYYIIHRHKVCHLVHFLLPSYDIVSDVIIAAENNTIKKVVSFCSIFIIMFVS